MMNETIHSAMPWIMMGLAIIIFAASALRRRQADDHLSEEERIHLKKKRNERLATCMAIGMAAGVVLGAATPLDLPSGVSVGALAGIAVGYAAARKTSTNRKIEAIVFDLGGVIVDTDENRAREILEEMGMELPEDKEAEAREQIEQLIKGYITLQQYVAYIRRYMPQEAADKEIGNAVLENLRGIPPLRVARLRELKKRYHVVLLSNIAEEVWQCAVRQMEEAGTSTEELFDECYLSYAMGTAKPEAEIYRKMIAQSHLDAGRTIYFDDRQENVEAGLATGLKAVKVEENHIEKLKEYRSL